MDIDSPHLNDLPHQTQRHVVGVGEKFGKLLWKMAWVVACYREHCVPRD